MTNPYRDEIAGYLRRAECHYGNTIRDEDDGLTPTEAAVKRDGVRVERIVELRRAVHQVADCEHSRTKTQAAHEDAVLRALLHFEPEITPELRRYVYARLAEVQSDPRFGLKVTTEPLACRTRGAQARRTPTAPPGDDGLPGAEMDADATSDNSAAIDEAVADWLSYASAEEIREVDELATTLALDLAARRWPDAMVDRMPHNNPGYDIEVHHPGGDIRHIEVKGTRSPDPSFFITANEVAHSATHTERYSIWIFAAMDLKAGTGTLHEHDGPVGEPHFELQPVQYRARLRDR